MGSLLQGEDVVGAIEGMAGSRPLSPVCSQYHLRLHSVSLSGLRLVQVQLGFLPPPHIWLIFRGRCKSPDCPRSVLPACLPAEIALKLEALCSVNQHIPHSAQLGFSRTFDQRPHSSPPFNSDLPLTPCSSATWQIRIQ